MSSHLVIPQIKRIKDGFFHFFFWWGGYNITIHKLCTQKSSHKHVQSKCFRAPIGVSAFLFEWTRNPGACHHCQSWERNLAFTHNQGVETYKLVKYASWLLWRNDYDSWWLFHVNSDCWSSSVRCVALRFFGKFFSRKSQAPFRRRHFSSYREDVCQNLPCIDLWQNDKTIISSQRLNSSYTSVVPDTQSEHDAWKMRHFLVVYPFRKVPEQVLLRDMVNKRQKKHKQQRWFGFGCFFFGVSFHVPSFDWGWSFFDLWIWQSRAV